MTIRRLALIIAVVVAAVVTMFVLVSAGTPSSTTYLAPSSKSPWKTNAKTAF